MEQTCGERAYSSKYMKKKIIEHFGDIITFVSTQGQEDKIIMKHTASDILSKFTKENFGLSEAEQKRKIISTAAKLIKSDIAAVDASKTFYPSVGTVQSAERNRKLLPDTLDFLLSSMFSGKDTEIKIAAIGQSIMQACRPKSLIAPLQLGLAVQVHHLYSSRFLVDELYQMGFSSSYSEVQRFQSNAAMLLNAVVAGSFPGQFLQYVADNADHNVCTLDGHGTFHGMGMVACSSPGSNVELPIPRADMSLTDLSRISNINIKYFKDPDNGMSDEFYFRDIGFGTEISDTLVCSQNPFDTFFKLIWPLKTSRPNWSGFMQLYTESHAHPGKANIKILPMIDMNPSDLSCINSTLHFVNDQCKKYGVTPVLTFDQPLFQKATFIIRCDPLLKNIVLRLGGFHTEMSFLASIGHIMSSTGLQEVLETIYAPNAVRHMLAGKAVHRAIRGHFLVDTALHTLLLSDALEVPLPLKEPNISENEDRTSTKEESSVELEDAPEMLKQLKEMYENLEKNKVSVSDVCSSELLQEVSQVLNLEKTKLKSNRTASLWL
ncbi:uncharacterized protein LOC123550249 [Mercenaria mercenaria]|uniref:uncharacterized protein LOC123550249 n=1 Tax=Mercenaria mercenaria TaxID=6596 RepID=UPI00234F4B93|nr:uncharacterized protein LOC123550249 [Mercenaria mercenaria]XP_053402975.1 uncharacterized protein LOC123550249 [Mercenaria mercenaria]